MNGLVKKTFSYQRNGATIEFYTLPDYLAVGSDSDFVRYELLSDEGRPMLRPRY